MPDLILEIAESVPAALVAVQLYSPGAFTVMLDMFTNNINSVPSLNHITEGKGSPAIIEQLMVKFWPSRR